MNAVTRESVDYALGEIGKGLEATNSARVIYKQVQYLYFLIGYAAIEEERMDYPPLTLKP